MKTAPPIAPIKPKRPALDQGKVLLFMFLSIYRCSPFALVLKKIMAFNREKDLESPY
jgi:hypothetical protein